MIAGRSQSFGFGGWGRRARRLPVTPLRRRFDQLALPFQLSQDAAHHGGGNLQVLLAQ